MTFFALGAKFGALGLRSNERGIIAASAPNNRSVCSIEFSAIAPKPTATSWRISLRDRNLFMVLFSPLLLAQLVLMTIQEIVGPKHRLNEQAQAFFGVRLGCDRPFRNFHLARRRRSVISLIKCDFHSFVVVTIGALEHLLR